MIKKLKKVLKTVFHIDCENCNLEFDVSIRGHNIPMIPKEIKIECPDCKKEKWKLKRIVEYI